MHLFQFKSSGKILRSPLFFTGMENIFIGICNAFLSDCLEFFRHYNVRALGNE